MKNPPTLADAIIGRCLSKHGHLIGGRKFAETLAGARKFVMDDSMSSFLADIGGADRLGEDTAASLNAMRFLSRLPHRVTWIEYNARVRHSRALEIGTQFLDPPSIGEMPARLGWLCIQHPTIDYAFTAIECASHTYGAHDETLEQAQPHFLAYAWCSEDHPLPWRVMDREMPIASHLQPDRATTTASVEGVLTGDLHYRSPHVGIMPSPLIETTISQMMVEIQKHNPIAELAGDLRYLWAFLSTINDLPVAFREVHPSKGYVAKGNYKKFISHTVVTLTVPTIRAMTILDRVQALARRKRHMVRGFWRETLKGKTWIAEHERGDAALGFVVHDYSVERFKGRSATRAG
ncbi:MAG: hypothetical protein EHM78_01940 [Myxococcaceae bacterium]|nr:MAG: hypothetical protein EHM78_01940 [Myxococcaceae bacterium]